MRRSSQIGFAASIALAVFSASFVSDVSLEQKWPSFWPQASAGMSDHTAPVRNPPASSGLTNRQALPNKIRRRDLLNRVHQKLSRISEAVDPILP